MWELRLLEVALRRLRRWELRGWRACSSVGKEKGSLVPLKELRAFTVPASSARNEDRAPHSSAPLPTSVPGSMWESSPRDESLGATRPDYSGSDGLAFEVSVAQLRDWASAHTHFLSPFGLYSGEIAHAEIYAPRAALARIRVRVGESALGCPDAWPAPQELRPECVAAFSWGARAMWLVAVCDADEHARATTSLEVSLLPLCREAITRLSKHWCARASGAHWGALRATSRAAVATAVEAHAPEVDGAMRMLWDCKLGLVEEESGAQDAQDPQDSPDAHEPAQSSRATLEAESPPLCPTRVEAPSPLNLGQSPRGLQGPQCQPLAAQGQERARFDLTQARKRQADDDADALFVDALWSVRGTSLSKVDRYRLSRLLDYSRARDVATAERGSMLAIRAAAQERLRGVVGERGFGAQLVDTENAETEVLFATYQPMSELASGSSTAIKKATPLVRPLIARQLLRAYEVAVQCATTLPDAENCADSCAHALNRAAVLLLDELVRDQKRPQGDAQNALVEMCGRLWEKQFLQCARNIGAERAAQLLESLGYRSAGC